MSAPQGAPQGGGPSPMHLFATLQAYQQTAAMKAAINLELFTAIAEGATTVPAIAARCKASERGIRVLADFLAIFGFLTKQGQEYGLTEESAIFLNKHSPAYLGSISTFLNDPNLLAAFNDLEGVVRSGHTEMPGEGTVSDDNPIWVEFAEAMAPIMRMPAQAMAQMVDGDRNRPFKLLDIAAGHGVFGIAVAQQYPNAQIHALDWGPVLEVAQRNAQMAGIADRYHRIPGSAFKVEFGSGYEVVYLTNFLHHFDPATNVDLLRKVRAAISDGGRAIALEFVPNDDRISPPGAATFSLTMLTTTPSGDAYTYAELDRMFRDAGFSKTELRPIPGLPQSVVVAEK